MNYTQETIRRYHYAWDEREKQARKSREEERLNACVQAKRLSEIIAQDQNVSKIVLFGSAIKPFRFRENSDIDLAVWGLPPEKYFSTLALLERECSYPLDLVPVEDARQLIRKRIEKGEVLFERKRMDIDSSVTLFFGQPEAG